MADFTRESETRRLYATPGREEQTRALYGARLSKALDLLKNPILGDFERSLANKMANSSFQALNQLGFISDAVQIRADSKKK